MNNGKIPYCTTKDGIDISFIEDESFRKFFSRFTKGQFIDWMKAEKLANEIYNNYENYAVEEFSENIPNYQEMFCFCLDARMQSDSIVDSDLELDLLFNNNCIITLSICLLLDNPVTSELNEYIGKNLDLNTIKYAPLFIRYGKRKTIDYDGKEILRFRFLDEKCYNYLQEICNIL